MLAAGLSLIIARKKYTTVHGRQLQQSTHCTSERRERSSAAGSQHGDVRLDDGIAVDVLVGGQRGDLRVSGRGRAGLTTLEARLCSRSIAGADAVAPMPHTLSNSCQAHQLGTRAPPARLPAQPAAPPFPSRSLLSLPALPPPQGRAHRCAGVGPAERRVAGLDVDGGVLGLVGGQGACSNMQAGGGCSVAPMHARGRSIYLPSRSRALPPCCCSAGCRSRTSAATLVSEPHIPGQALPPRFPLNWEEQLDERPRRPSMRALSHACRRTKHAPVRPQPLT